MISIIAAVSANNVIGTDGDLPWRLPADLARFKRLTMGKPIVMGRLTWDSIGRPLPGRQNIVLTRQTEFSADGCDIVASPAEALAVAGKADEVMVIGGGQIYDLFLSKASRLYVTRVHAEIDGDAYFPEIDDAMWMLSGTEAHAVDDENQFAFDFTIYDRVIAVPDP